VFGAAAAKRGRTRSCQAGDHAPDPSAPTCGESDEIHLFNEKLREWELSNDRHCTERSVTQWT